MNLDDLRGRRVAVWGLGTEGRAMVELLSERGTVPLVIDDRPDVAGEPPVGTVLDPSSVPWDRLDVVVRSPGVSRYRPELVSARSAGIAVTTAMALWLDDFAGRPVIAVTGTKGKSTTAALAASILRHDGASVELIGNIGVPVTDTYGRAPVDAYVVEVSSYQAAEVTTTPTVCVLTSLAPDHLSWHGTLERYYGDKLKLVDAGPPGALAVNAASAEAVRRTSGHAHRILFGTEGRVVAGPDGMVSVDGRPAVYAGDLAAPGAHNLWNLCGAISGMLLLRGAPPSRGALAAAVGSFEGLPSRCRTLGVRHGLTFVDDALASNPFATVSSIGVFEGRELAVILGGDDRGVDPTELADALVRRRPAPLVVVLPPHPERLVGALKAADDRHRSARELEPEARVEVAADLHAAVDTATRGTPRGGVVLFSPAAPTPDGEGGTGRGAANSPRPPVWVVTTRSPVPEPELPSAMV